MELVFFNDFVPLLLFDCSFSPEHCAIKHSFSLLAARSKN